jgi:hypothetical protein
LKIETQAAMVAINAKIPLDEIAQAKITKLGQETEFAAQQLKGYQLVQAATEPHEKYRKEIENNELVLTKFGATSEQMAEVQKKTAEKYGNTWEQVGESVAGSFASIGNSFSKESKSMAMVAKAAGIIQATISMFVGSAKALELPFPANIAAWAAVAAKGAAVVASIKSTAVAGFATGADFRIPGGIGGADNVPVSFMAQPGERVKVEPNRYGADSDSGGSRVANIYAPALVDRSGLRAIAKGIESLVGDGLRINLVPA